LRSDLLGSNFAPSSEDIELSILMDAQKLQSPSL
jgi:hypothetical protein